MNKYIAGFCFLFAKFILPCQSTEQPWFRTSTEKISMRVLFLSVALEKFNWRKYSDLRLGKTCS